MLFAVFRYSAQDSADGTVVEWVLADQLALIFDYGHPNIVFFAPLRLCIDIPIFDFRLAANQGQQLFEHDLAEVAAFSGVVVQDRHLIHHR